MTNNQSPPPHAGHRWIKTEWSPVAVKPQATAELYAELFRVLYPAWAARCNGRIAKAIQICTTVGACRRTASPYVFEVQSQSNPRGWYRIDMKARTCTCPDDGKNQTGPKVICKHRLAIAFHIFGPDWTQVQKGDLVLRCHALKQAMEQAWRDHNRIATMLESLPVEAIGTPKAEQLAARMRQAEENAGRLQEQYYQLYDQIYKDQGGE